MNEEIVKTVKWSDAKELLAALANKNLGRAKNNKPADFNEFVTAYPAVTQKRMFDFLENIVLRNSLNDVTSLAVIAEDSCLFSAEAVTAIDIVLRHLKTLNTGGKLKSLWGYLDTDKKAVIHFINKGGWYAEAYFSSSENFSVIHLLKTAEGQRHFIPVAFIKDMSKATAKVSLTGGFCLHDYLPRVKYDFLSKGGKQGKNGSKNGKSSRNGRDSSGIYCTSSDFGRDSGEIRGRHDKWDGL